LGQSAGEGESGGGRPAVVEITERTRLLKQGKPSLRGKKGPSLHIYEKTRVLRGLRKEKSYEKLSERPGSV